MTTTNQSLCEHCGAFGASLFANDGSRVCQECFAYDQVVAGELRASQVDLGLTASGDATMLEQTTAKAWHQELGMGIVFATLGLALLAFGIYDQNALAYVASAIVTMIALPLLVQAVRTMRFARSDAPRIVARASSAPPRLVRGTSAAVTAAEGRSRAGI